jgi:hypothetical protein
MAHRPGLSPTYAGRALGACRDCVVCPIRAAPVEPSTRRAPRELVRQEVHARAIVVDVAFVIVEAIDRGDRLWEDDSGPTGYANRRPDQTHANAAHVRFR